MRFSSLCALGHGCMPSFTRRGLSAAPLLSVFLGIILLSADHKPDLDAVSLDAEVPSRLGGEGETKLSLGWKMISAADVHAGGEVISMAGYDTSGWYAAVVPGTVYGTLADNGVLGDIFLGDNFSALPEHLSDYSGSAEYWFRTEFVPSQGAQAWLLLHGISFRADVWLNGQGIATQSDCYGPFIPHEYLVTGLVHSGTNALAIKVNETGDPNYFYGIVWNDWNQYKNATGIVRDVIFRVTAGDVAVKDPYVVTMDLPLPDPAAATLSVNVNLDNGAGGPVSGTLKGEISKAGTPITAFQQEVSLQGRESKWVSQAVTIPDPQLWWPYQIGTPNLYQLRVWFERDGVKSDSNVIDFGIRKFEEYKTPEGWWGLTVNGNKMLVRGAGYSPEVFLRYPTRRNQAEMMYFKTMGLNTLRFEGFTTNDELYDICDREGILIMNGGNVVWEDHSDDPHMNVYNRAYTEWQMREFRHHPSLGIWNNGSDIEPSYGQSAEYGQILSAYSFRVDGAFAKNVSEYGARDPWDGIKMQGPYNYVSPYYFWEGNAYKGGGAWGFCAEEGPGIMFPEYESLVRFLPPRNLWPIDATWQYHAPIYVGSTACPLCLTQASIDGRYGASSSAEEFVQKAQLSQYESVRAMYESYAANKSNVSRPSTGVIMWMFNMAIPGMGWQMYDYYLKPNSATFAAQKACARLLHASYNYSAKSVWISNESLERSPSVRVSAAVYDLGLNPLYSHEELIPSLEANSSREMFTIGDVPALSPVYFIRLQTRDAADSLLEDNVYWYSTRRDVVNYDLDGVPTQYADLTALDTLPVNDEVALSGTRYTSAGEDIVTINVANRSATKLAFFLRVEVTKDLNGPEVTPVTYSDNYVSLWPDESRTLRARYRTVDLGGGPAYLRVRGFHVGPLTSAVREPRVLQRKTPIRSDP